MRLILTFFLSIFMMTAVSAQDTKFADWDTDGDGLLERHEFTQKFCEEYFSKWNPVDKKGILEEGFFKETYAGLDTDNDNMLSDEEWLIGYNYFFDDYLVNGEIMIVDTDNDGMIEYAEYYDSLYETRYFTDTDLDSDNYISEYELANFVFDNWDLNDSGLISRSEFVRFDWYYLDV